jgi:glutamate carboxypeptidase
MTALPVPGPDLAGRIAPRLGAILDRTRELASVDSGSRDPAGVNAVTELVHGYLAPLGFTARRASIGPDRGDFFTATLELGPGPRVLILGHADTVWPAGTAAGWLVTRDGNALTGPGVGDMKCALAMAAEAIAAVVAGGARPDRDHRPGAITYALVPDEELGSVGSRALIEEAGRNADRCLTLESGLPGGGVISSRGAVGAMIITARGRTAHATDLRDQGGRGGASALRALAPLVAELESLTAFEQRRIVTVGILRSGTARQVIPDHAEMHVDLRAPDARAGAALERQVRELALARATTAVPVEIAGGLTRPPMPAALSASLYAQAERACAALAEPIFPHAEMGGSDASFVAAQGTPTLDGLGPIAHDQCSRREAVEVSSIVPRTILLASLIAAG